MLESLFTDPELLKELSASSTIKVLKKDSVVISPGEEILFIPIVLRGNIRDIRQNEDGAEIFLYHLYPGQTCAMSLTCCQSHSRSMIKAVAETDTEIARIPVKLLEDWFRFPQWKAYVNNNYQFRFSELLDVIDLIAFNQLDKQLVNYLSRRAQALGTRKLQVTHQQVADELHTHREGISRLLRKMEEKKMLRLGRNSIELLFD